MIKRIRVALAQINPTVGDLRGNRELILQWARRARRQGATVVVFPELTLTGYPPEDLLLKPHFIEDNRTQVRRLARQVRGIVAVVGFVDRVGEHRYNAAAILAGGRIAAVYRKRFLPNYGVFDEQRYFRSGEALLTISLARVVFGVTICEDVWHAETVRQLARQRGAQVILTLNASPYHTQKWRLREAVLAPQAKQERVVMAYVNLVGGQDELVFDGGSMVIDTGGRVVARARQFREALLLLDIGNGGLTLVSPKRSQRSSRSLHPPLSPSKGERIKVRGSRSLLSFQHLRLVVPSYRPAPVLVTHPPIGPVGAVEEVYEALVLGTRDYVRKNGFRKVIIGLSGGIDSSLVATIAVDALGRNNVIGVFLPSRYSSQASREDAQALAERLGITWRTLSIEPAFGAYLQTLAATFKGRSPDITEENLQARIRGNLLMALSNKFGWLVLTTGNKSEMGVGYATLYGDMAGGFAVIKDVPKTTVYQLARFRNQRAGRQPIPLRVFEKAPTAELKPNQRDQDTLPPYEVLDTILRAYIEEDKGLKEIVALGCGARTVRRVMRLVDRSEYKRRQAPPGVKITPKAFGKDRRMPITWGRG